MLQKITTLFFSLLFFTTLQSAIIYVGPPPASIQNAINIASDGDIIQLSAGIYIEEIQVISKSLTIQGLGKNITTIQSPNASFHLTQNFVFGSNFWCVVMIDNQAAPTPQTVIISDLTVDGSNQQDTTIPPFYGASNRFFAIGYHNAAGTVNNVHTTNTRQTSNFNELAGGGIVNASNQGTIIFNVTSCLVDFYQRIGIDCRGSAVTANITNNTVNRGYFLTPGTITAAPNGIQFSGSATGRIQNNIVSENISTVFGVQSVGILPFNAGANVVVSGNTANDNDIGIAAISCGNNLLIDTNTVNFTILSTLNSHEGILVQDTNGLTTLNSNIMNNISDVNMDLSSTNQPFQLMNNHMIGSQTGLLVTGNGTSGPMVTMNGDSFSGTLGYYIEEVMAPNNIWPSTATVSFDGLISGHMTLSEYNSVLSKILDQHTDPSLGLVIDYIVPFPPTIMNINPNSGPQTGGTLVSISGNNFISANTQVFFGTTAAINVNVISDILIQVLSPPGTGTVNVTVSTPFGTTPISPQDVFTYLLPPVPTGYGGSARINTSNHNSPITIHSGNNFKMATGTLANTSTSVSTINAPVSIEALADFSMDSTTSDVGSNANAAITSGGNVVIQAASMHIDSGSGTNAYTKIVTSNGGTLSLNSAGEISLQAGFSSYESSDLSILTLKGGDIEITGEVINMNAGTGTQSNIQIMTGIIQGSGNIALSGTQISAVGNNIPYYSEQVILATGWLGEGAINLNSTGDITFINTSVITNASTGANPITLSADGDITLSNGTLFTNKGNISLFSGGSTSLDSTSKVNTGGNNALALVVINKNNTMMTSGFTYPVGARILANKGQVGKGAVQIYTVARDQNHVQTGANINGLQYIPGIEFTDTNQEYWDVSYPTIPPPSMAAPLPNGKDHFTIYYQVGGP